MNWWERAACKGKDPGLWFPVDDRRSDGFASSVARRICAGCPVRVECAGYAVELVDRGVVLEGTWAGVTVKTHQQPAGVDRLRMLAHR